MKYVFIGLIALTVIWAIPMVGVFHKMRKVRDWPSVTGRVLRSECKAYIPPYHQKNPSNVKSMDKFIHDLAYTYEVNGSEYTGELVSLMPARPEGKSAVESLAGSYSEGGEVTVFYDPMNPSVAVLNTGFDGSLFRKFVVFVAILLAVGIAGLRNYL